MVEESNAKLDMPGLRRIFGYVLVAAAAGTVFFMAHHPTSITHLTGIAAMVHGVMLLMLLLLASGFSHFAWALGLHRPLVLIALVSYLVSTVFNVLAAVVNGFVVPALAVQHVEGASADVFHLAWETNQVLARLAVVAAGLAYVLWSSQLLRQRMYWLAAAGFIAGLSTLLMLIWSAGEMDVKTAIVVYSTQVLWAALVGIVIIRKGSQH